MSLVFCATTQPMRDSKAPRDRLTGAGLKSPSAAVVKSHGREHRRKRSGVRSDQVGNREMNESEPLMTCRNVYQTRSKPGGSECPGIRHGRSLFRTMRPPALRRHDSVALRLSGTWEPSAPMLTEQFKQKPCEDLSRKAARRGGTVRSSEEVPDKGMEPRDRVQRDWNIVPTRDGRSQCPSQNQNRSPLPGMLRWREGDG
jgi:hypothetical protein